jgi:molybdopterin synthase sulfur carrier subunit
MRITVLYFARLREAVGTGREVLDLPAGVGDVAALREWISGRGEPWSGAFANIRPLLAAVDQVQALEQTRLTAGAEVAFFPPVTGG